MAMYGGWAGGISFSQRGTLKHFSRKTSLQILVMMVNTGLEVVELSCSARIMGRFAAAHLEKK